MGIRVPDDEEIPPATGQYCLMFGNDQMENLELTLSGIAQVTPNPPPVPWNKLYTLEPKTSCTWYKLLPLGGVDELEIYVTFAPDFSDVIALLLPSRLPVYRCTQSKEVFYGINQAVYPYAGGTHQIEFAWRDYKNNLQSTCENLRIDTKQKTFVEPEGVALDGSGSNIRIARQHDGTNVYLKRP